MCTFYQILRGPAVTVMQHAELLADHGFDVHRAPVLREQTFTHEPTNATMVVLMSVMVMKRTLTREPKVIECLGGENEFISFL